MTTTLASLAAAAVVTFAVAAWAGETETGGKTLDEARLAVEKSSLTKDTKREILTKADRAVKAGVPSEDAAIIIDRGLKHGADGKSIAGFLETAATVKERDLPMRPVLDRIEQGLSKGVPAERILSAAQGLAEKLATARPIVNDLVRSGVQPVPGRGHDDAIETVARALEKSFPENAIMRTGEKVKEQKGSISLFAKAVDTMTTFAASGMATDRASRLVQAALDKGYSERDMEKMEKTLFDDLKKGRSMNEVAEGLENRMNRDNMHEGRGRIGGEQMRGPGAGIGGPRR
jgi:hypothetical protein